MKVIPGDLVILATDGLFDNMFDEDIASEISPKLSELKEY